MILLKYKNVKSRC